MMDYLQVHTMAVVPRTMVQPDMVARSRFPEADFNQRQLCLESRPQGHDPVHRHAVLHALQDPHRADVHETNKMNQENVHDPAKTDVESKEDKDKKKSNLFPQAGEQGCSLPSVSSPLRKINSRI